MENQMVFSGKVRIFFVGILSLLLLAGCNMPADLGEPTNPEQISAQAEGSNLLETSEREEENLSDSTVELSEVSGNVLRKQTAGDALAAAANSDLLFTGGLVQTGADSQTRLDFSDGTFVRAGSDSLFTFEGTEESENGLFKRLFLHYGQLWIVLNGGELEVGTTSGAASVVGSYLMVFRDEETGDIYTTCLEGTCTLEFNGQQVVFGAGQTAQIIGGEGPETGLMTEEDIREWLENNPEAEVVLAEVLSSVGNFVWEDQNGNGLQDEGEPGLAGVTVELYDADATLLETQETNENGAYLFDGLWPGEYFLKFSAEGSLFTVQNAGENDKRDSDANQDGQTEPFYLPPATEYADVDAGMLSAGNAVLCPLTGLTADKNTLPLRPIFISMSMFPAQSTRPQTGINSAPVVFETLIDEGQTRLQVLFYCGYPEKGAENNSGDGEGGNDNVNGSYFDISGVRSGRVFYAELSQLFGAGLIFAGASANVYQTIAPYQCAIADNKSPGNIGGAGVNIGQLKQIAENCQTRLGNTDLGVWTFGPPPEGGIPVTRLLMHYNELNQTRWIYDAEAGGYVRYHNNPASPEEFPLSTDRLTGEATVRQNIILLQVPHNVLNSSGTIIEFDLTDERGYAWLLRDGYLHEVCWSTVFNDYPAQSNRYRPFLLMDCQTKEPVNFASGSTWINVVDPSFWFEEKGDFYMAKQPFLGYGP